MKHCFTSLVLAALTFTTSFAATNLNHSTSTEHRSIYRTDSPVPVTEPTASYDIITEQPAGDKKIYARSGKSLFNEYGTIIQGNQEGRTISIVWSPDRDMVYFQGIISEEASTSWVKATVEGNKIHLPLYQVLHFYVSEGYGYMLAKGNKSGNSWEVDLTATEMTFTLNDDGSMALDDTQDGASILTLVWTDNYEWTGDGDYETVFSPVEAVEVQIPEGAETETWMLRYNNRGEIGTKVLKGAMVGDTLYIAGLQFNHPDNAFYGVVNGDKITFQSNQFLGKSGKYLMHFVCATYVGEEFTYVPSLELSFDPVTRKIDSPEGVSFLLNGGRGDEALYFWGTMTQPHLEPFIDVACTPADPEFLAFNETMSDNGYNSVKLNVKPIDVEGNYLNTEKLYYMLWVMIDDEPEPYVFYADEYYSFMYDGLSMLKEVPFNYSSYSKYGYTDIYPTGSTIFLYQVGFDDYGVQTIYYGGNERTTSNIAWYSQSAGIDQLKAESPKAAAVFDLSGRRTDSLGRGFQIVVNADGSTRKVIR